MHLKQGDSAKARIWAKKWWNDSGIYLEPGDYRYDVDPEDTWSDAQIQCNAEGYASPSAFMRGLLWTRRHNGGDRWFELVGAVNKENFFKIGTHTTHPVVGGEGGTLFCFANDAMPMYWNNSGSVWLRVTRLA
jgi:hypothetical protein